LSWALAEMGYIAALKKLIETRMIENNNLEFVYTFKGILKLYWFFSNNTFGTKTRIF